MTDKQLIDIVITWVNGNDEYHKQEIKPYLNNLEYLHEDIAGATRYNSEGEILFCISSILLFAPFVRKIFVVTDHQNPHADNLIQSYFPENNIPIEVIDHTVIFKDYEDFLPVFNSLSIETCLFRIPDLSEQFVYFNDDVFLIRPVKPEDWFVDNKAVAYGTWRNIAWDRFLSFIKPRKNGHKKFRYKDSIMNAADCIGLKTSYFCIEHTPQPLKKSVFEEYYNQHSDLVISNISHKFRNETQYNPQSLFYMLTLHKNDSIQKPEEKLVFIKPVNREKSYVNRKIKLAKSKENILFCCMESIDLAKNEDRDKLFEWLRGILRNKYTEKQTIEIQKNIY
jgi:hypothetical protein